MTDDQNSTAVFCGQIVGQCNEYGTALEAARHERPQAVAAVRRIADLVGEILADAFGAMQVAPNSPR